MNLLDIRTQVVRQSGRYDLIGGTAGAPDFTEDRGIDQFIDEGLRFLCDMVPSFLSRRTYRTVLAQDKIYKVISRLRRAERIWLTRNNVRTEVHPKELAWLKREFPEPFENVTPALPMWWTEVVAEAALEETEGTMDIIENLRWFVQQLSGGIDGVFAYGPIDAAESLKVTATSPESMRVLVNAGAGFLDGMPFRKEESELTDVFVAPAANPRIDIVCVIASTGFNHIVMGEEDAAPVAPEVPAGRMKAAEIYHRVGETGIYEADDDANGYITDARIMMNQ